MNQALHDALADLATEISPRLPAPAPARHDPWHRAVAHRRRRRAGSFAVALVLVLLGALVVSATGRGTLGRTVSPSAPSSGAGSLPDRIFPTRSAILSVAQAPIGRAALVYDGPVVGSGSSRSSTVPIAVGADADVYRVLPAASSWSLSPDGRTFAYLEEPAAHDVVAARLHLLSLGSGKERVVRLSDEGHGLAASITVALLWSPAGSFVATLLDVRDHPVGSGDASAHAWLELIDARTGAVTSRPGETGELIDWYDSTSILVQEETGTRAIDPATGQVRQSFGTQGGYLVGSYSQGQQMFLSPDRRWVTATHQDPGAVFHDVQVAELPQETDDQGPQDARRQGPYETSNGKPPRDDQQPLGWISTDMLAVKAQTFIKPAAGFGGGVRLVVAAVQLPSLRSTELLHADTDAHVNNLQLAADVLAGGRVRHAAAPQQPLLDLRTLTPAVGLWLHDWWLLILVPCLAIGLLLFARRRSRLP